MGGGSEVGGGGVKAGGCYKPRHPSSLVGIRGLGGESR